MMSKSQNRTKLQRNNGTKREVSTAPGQNSIFRFCPRIPNRNETNIIRANMYNVLNKCSLIAVYKKSKNIFTIIITDIDILRHVLVPLHKKL